MRIRHFRVLVVFIIDSSNSILSDNQTNNLLDDSLDFLSFLNGGCGVTAACRSVEPEVRVQSFPAALYNKAGLSKANALQSFFPRVFAEGKKAVGVQSSPAALYNQNLFKLRRMKVR